VDRTERSSGSDFNPVWPTVGSGERAGERQETYSVTFAAEDGSRYTTIFAETRWRTFRLGDSHILEIDRGGNVTAVDP
jgi:hypothetical protein